MSGETDNEVEPADSGFSTREANRGMRTFIFSGIFGAARAQIVSVGTAIMTGYALWLGMSEPMIGLMLACATGSSMVVLVSLRVIMRFRDRKMVLIVLGIIASVLRGGIVLIPYIFYRHLWGAAMLIMLIFSNLFLFSFLPLLQSWLGAIIPEKIRGSFLGKLTMINTISGMIMAFCAGVFIDCIKDGLYGFDDLSEFQGFAIVFVFAALLGIARVLVLRKAPFPRHMEHKSAKFRGFMKVLKEHPKFVSLLAFNSCLLFTASIAGTYYTVFMLKHLELSITTVTCLLILQQILSLIGLRAWGKLIDRYGCKPIMQTLVVVVLICPVLWIFNTKSFFIFAVAAMMLTGIAGSGILIAMEALKFQTSPNGEDRPILMAANTACCNISMALGAGGAALLSFLLRDFDASILGFGIKGIQVIFLVSAIGKILPLILVHRLEDKKAVSPGKFIGQFFQGNIFNYLYGSFQFSRAFEVEQRVRATDRLGRSKSPMALETLSRALEDPDVSVQRAATRALGETRRSDAVSILAQHLHDKQSPVRHEAAEALGRIKSPAGIEHLLKALDDHDPQVRASAVTALGDIGGKYARQGLFAKFSGPFDPLLFPLLAQSLGRIGELAIVPEAVSKIDEFSSIVVKRQILHSVCRLFDGRGDFYRALFMDQWKSITHIEKMLASIKKDFSGFNKRSQNEHYKLLDAHEKLANAFTRDEFDLSKDVITGFADELVSVIGQKSPYNITAHKALEAVNTFYRTKSAAGLKNGGVIFSVLCLRSAVDPLNRA